MSDRLHGQVAIITGGASGVGEGGTRAFAEAGAIVVIADLNQDRGAALASELGEADGRSIVFCGTADAMIGIDGFDSYVAAKGGVLSFVEAMGEYRPADQ